MANMNLYSRGDKMFVRINMILIGIFTLSTLCVSSKASVGLQSNIGWTTHQSTSSLL